MNETKPAATVVFDMIDEFISAIEVGHRPDERLSAGGGPD